MNNNNHKLVSLQLLDAQRSFLKSGIMFEETYSKLRAIKEETPDGLKQVTPPELQGLLSDCRRLRDLHEKLSASIDYLAAQFEKGPETTNQ